MCSIDYNYHTHTERCHHATGSDDDYIKCAIEAGIKHLGFSDHAPYVFPDGYESHYRINLENAREYVTTIKALADKYSDKIKIKVGLEMEYYPEHFENMLGIARNIGAEYLILGQHFVGNEHPDMIGSKRVTDDAKLYRQYVDQVINGIKTGVFSYVAHPDIMIYRGNEAVYRAQTRRLCLAAKEHSVPLEINLAGLRHNLHYPSDRFFEIAAEIGAPVTIGFDAHDCSALLDRDWVRVAEDMIARHRLNYIGKPKIISIK